MNCSPDIAIYDTSSFTILNEIRDRKSKGINLYKAYLTPVELNPVNETIQLIQQLSKVGENWDGYDAKAPDLKIIENAVYFLNSLPSYYQKMLNISDISLTPYGTVVLEWYKNDLHYVSIEIGATKLGLISETATGENPYFDGIEIFSNEAINKILPVFYQVFSKA